MLSARYTTVELTIAKAFSVELPHLLTRLTAVLNKRKMNRSMIIRILYFADAEKGGEGRSGLGSHMSAILI